MAKRKKGISKIIIPDTHTMPGVSNERMGWAAQFAIDKKANRVIHLGDLFDMGSLSSYDKGKKAFEGRRYVDDIDAGIDALEIFNNVIADHNRRHTKKYQPIKDFFEGNHEDRIRRAANDAAELFGLISLDDCQLKEFGWDVTNFKESKMIEGVMYSHYFCSGIMGKAISGVNLGRSLTTKNKVSSIQGHSHVLDLYTETRADGRRIWGISAGCFLDNPHSYAKGAQHMWWSGLLHLSNVRDGDMDVEIISYDTLKEMYGG